MRFPAGARKTFSFFKIRVLVLALASAQGRGVEITTHLKLMPWLRMRRAMHPLPQHVFLACPGT